MRSYDKVMLTMFGILPLLLAAVTPAAAQDYPNPPPVLVSEVRKAAESCVLFLSDNNTNESRDALDSKWPMLVLYVVVDALADPEEIDLQGIWPYIYAGESRRTDKQTGAGPSGSGSTTLVEKPGIPELLAFAVENGALQQEARGTNLTMSTSPYALLILRKPDTQASYERYGFWRRIGLSATFPMNSTAEDSLGSLDPREISEWSLQLRILGDRSTRSKKFADLWMARLQSRISARLEAITGGLHTILKGALLDRSDAAFDLAWTAIKEYHLQSGPVTDEQKQMEIEKLIFTTLRTEIHEPISEGDLVLDSSDVETVLNEIVPRLISAHESLAGIQSDINAIIEEVNRSMLITVKFTNHREFIGTNYSELKILADGVIEPVDVLFNAGISLNHDPDEALDQSTIRDFSFSASLLAHFDNVFRSRQDTQDQSRITFSVSGRYVRLENVRDDMGIFQAKLDIPLSSGLSVPFSATYATRTDLIDESNVSGNFGISFDMDKLFAAARSALE